MWNKCAFCWFLLLRYINMHGSKNVKFQNRSLSPIITYCIIQIALRPSSSNLCIQCNHCHNKGVYFASGSDSALCMSPRRGACIAVPAYRTRCCQGLTLETSLGLQFPLTEFYSKHCASNSSCIMHICSKKMKLDFLQSLRLSFGSCGFRWKR
jgi:ribosomal protein S27E